MPSWIQQSISRGILTSHYPKDAATDEEIPATGRPPLPIVGASAASAVDACPVGAIVATGVDQGKCIRCARCLPRGFAFAGRVESSTRGRAALTPGTPTENVAHAAAAPLSDLRRSVHVFLVDVGSCNACNLEVLALANPYYDSQRLGIFFTNSPRHADVLLIVGVPTPEMIDPLQRAYDAVPGPKAVVAVGACAISGGAFAGAPGLTQTLDALVPVDVYIPGCPPSPITILDGLLRVVGRGRRAAGD